MDIKRAKKEMKDSLEAYLAKDAYGDYKIPAIRQRPILLMGPPGIGKTQIMEQVAKECRVNLVSYTITHHTRQSAVGLPFIRERVYAGKTCSVTDYTMSEILASVYEKIEQTGKTEGILFIDEINCVSETLAPTMLQFLQCKTFGNQKLPEGWVIAAAGNPPEYNKSVREFDVVTLDRVKWIEVEENYPAWKEYAHQAGIHPAILAYLELRKNYFYVVETTVEGKAFVTARGWEDLSQLLFVYEDLGKKVDVQVIRQYLQHEKIAKDFAAYLELYAKYKKDYGLEKVLEGGYGKETIEKLKYASFDERLSIVNLLYGKMEEWFRRYKEQMDYVTELHKELRRCREGISVSKILEEREQWLKKQTKEETLFPEERRLHRRVQDRLEDMQRMKNGSDLPEPDSVKAFFQKDLLQLEKIEETVQRSLDTAFDFLEEAFGDSQEMVVFVTSLNSGSYSLYYLKDHLCEKYFLYNKKLLTEEQHQTIMEEIKDLEGEKEDEFTIRTLS